jgi:FkbM family methyltransferase
MNALTNTIRKFVRRCGYDMVHFTPLKPLLEKHEIDLVLDVGANIGQTYDLFREAGFSGKIVSFEPNPEVFAILERKCGDDWEKLKTALSTTAGEAEFFATSEKDRSGLHAPLTRPVLARFKVPMQRLDQIWHWDKKSAFLKIDTEGHDLEVLRGATGVLNKINLVMVEAALTSRYEGEPVFLDVVKTLGDFGFQICKIQRIFTDPARGVDTDMDLIFCRGEKSATA